MISTENIEDEIFNYVVKNGKCPKYILLDRNSYREFNSYFKPREKISTPEPKDFRVVSWHSTHTTRPIDILSVNTDKDLLEAVG